MATQDKIDLYKLHKAEYATPKQPVLVEVKPARYLVIEGGGAPGSAEFQDKIGALYGVAYTVKMTRKFDGQQDYVVGKLEALYWDPKGRSLSGELPESLRWKFLIRTPDFVEPRELEEAASKQIEKGKSPTVKEVRLETLAEGDCVQMVHVGPYERLGETLSVMRRFLTEEGLVQDGYHHDIYLSDPRRAAPEKLRTILRLPVRRSGS